MLKWILGILGGLVWCLIVFIAALWLTFPSQAIVDRAAFEVQKASNGAYALKAASAAPWWTGLALYDVQLLAVDPDTGESSLVLAADSVAARTQLFALMNTDVPVHGVVDLGGSRIVVDAEIDRGSSRPRLTMVRADAPKLGVNALGALLAPYGVTLTGDGDLDVHVDMEIADDVKDHDGRISVKGSGVRVTASMPDPISGGSVPFELGPVKVSKLEFTLDVRDGKATFKDGLLRSDHATLDLSGMVSLNQRLNRSRIRAQLVVEELGGTVATFEPLMSNARCEDEKYHYRLSCSLDKFNGSCVRPDCRGSRNAAGGGVRRPLPIGGDLGGTPGITADPGGATVGSADIGDAEARAERRRALREQRLAERRQRIEEERAARGEEPERPGDRDEDEVDDEEDMDEPDLVNPDPGMLTPPDVDIAPVPLPGFDPATSAGLPGPNDEFGPE